MGIGKITVSNGLQKKATKMNIGGTHITSMDFGRLQVLHCSLLQPKDKVKLDIRHNIRLSPLVAPTIGNCKLKTKAFFVPSRVAWSGWESFISETPWSVTGGTVTPFLPKVSNDTFAGVFNAAVSFSTANSEVRAGYPQPRPFGTEEGIGKKYSTNLPWLSETDIRVNVRAPYYDISRPLGEIVGITDGLETGTNKLKHFVPFDHLELHGALGSYDYPIYDWDNVQTSVPLDGFDYITLPCWAGGSTDSRLHYGVYGYNYQNTLQTGNNDWKNKCHYFVCRFTRYGKGLYNLFLSLGYKINFQSLMCNSANGFAFSHTGLGSTHAWVSSAKPSSSSFVPSTGTSATCFDDKSLYGYHTIANSLTSIDHTLFNAMPIYSFMRIYLDYFAPTQFYSMYERVIDWYQKANNYQIHWSDLYTLAELLYSNYDKDIFTSAWQEPNSPLHVGSSLINPFSTRTYSVVDNNGQPADIVHPDRSSGHMDVVLNNAKSSGVIAGSYGTNQISSPISDLAIRLVRAMTKYSRINNVFGYRAVDRFLGKYGIRPNDERINRAEMIGGSRSEFDVNLVMSQADTTTANLGDFVGHGESVDVSSLGSYSATEWGYLFIVAWITPKAMYYQGRNRMTLYTEASDFHDPIIDDLDAMQSIRYDELVADSKFVEELAHATNYKPSNVFGYTRMWHECKHGSDLVTGDFYIDSCGKYSNQSFHLGRQLPSVGDQNQWVGNFLQNDENFNLCRDAYQYDRIFQTSDIDLDHFYCYFKIDVICYRYTKALTDFTLDGENDDTRTSSMEMFGTQIV